MAELPQVKPQMAGVKPKARTSVSAEVFGKYNAKGVYTVKKVDKPASTVQKI